MSAEAVYRREERRSIAGVAPYAEPRVGFSPGLLNSAAGIDEATDAVALA